MINNNATYFDFFVAEHIRRQTKAFSNNKNSKTNFFKIQAYESIMCGYIFIGFIDFMFNGKIYFD